MAEKNESRVAENKPSTKSWSQIWYDFGTNTSLHGLKQIVEHQPYVVRRYVILHNVIINLRRDRLAWVYENIILLHRVAWVDGWLFCLVLGIVTPGTYGQWTMYATMGCYFTTCSFLVRCVINWAGAELKINIWFLFTPLFSRFIWLLLVLTGLALFLYQMTTAIIYYHSYPVSVNVKINYNKSIRFPAVTICNQNGFRLV